ncbi:MAG: sugar ABC transporter permease [Clostridia bacterium]|nr:sugar ABC transporter permease [Clostridia bacterium]
MMESKKSKTLLVHSAAHVIMIVVCILFLVPIIYTLLISLKSSNSLVSSTLEIIPKDVTLDNYKAILFEEPFFVWTKNSLILTLSTVVFALAVASPAAYAYSRFKFKLRSGTLYMFLLLNAFPAILSMVAIYRLLRILGLMNTYSGLILVYTGGMIIFGIWNMKGYFDSIPVEIEHAAMIDGASHLKILISIVLPLARPVLIVTGVMIFISTWNEYIYAVNFLTSRDKFTLATGLYSLQGTEFTRNWPVFAAGSLIVSFPVLIVFFLIQKYMVSGLTVGGIK